MSMMLELQKKLNQKLQQKLDSEKSQQNQGTSIKKESTQASGLANESNEEKEARLQRLKESRRMLELKFSGQQVDNTNTNEIQGQQDTTVTQNYNIQQSTVVISSSAPPPPPLGLDILDIPSFPLSQPIRTPYKQQQPQQQQQQQQQLLVSSSAPPPPPILDFTNPSIPPPPPISTLNNNNTQNTISHPVFAETSIPPPPPAGLLDFKPAQTETNQVSSQSNKPQEVSEEQNNQVSTDQNKQEEQKEQSNTDIANNKHQSLNTDKDIPINFVESANIVDSQVNQVDASNVEVIFKTTNDQQKDQGDNKQQDNQKDYNNNTNDNNPDNNVSTVPEQPSPGLKAHLRRTNKKTVGITSIGSIFGFTLSKAQLNEELFPPSDMIQSHSPYSTFDKHSFNTINNQLRGDSEYPEQQVLYLSRQALVVEVLEGYVQNSSKNANRQLFRKNLQELIEKRVVENCTKASEASSKATKSLDLKLYEKAIASIQTAMQKMSQQNRFEECIQLRDAIKRIEELRTQIESTKENETRDSQIDFLNSELANIIMANHNKSGTSSTIHV